MHRLHAVRCWAGLSYTPIMGKDTFLVAGKKRKLQRKQSYNRSHPFCFPGKEGDLPLAQHEGQSLRHQAACAHTKSIKDFEDTAPVQKLGHTQVFYASQPQITCEGQGLCNSA